MPLVYALTASGQETLTTDATKGNLPQDYRRLLGMVEVGGHEEVIRGRMRRFPDRLIQDWRKELEDPTLDQSRGAGGLDAITVTAAPHPGDSRRIGADRSRLAKATARGSATWL